MIMDIKSFDSYDIADMARAFPDEAECMEASEAVDMDDKRYAFIACYGRIKAAGDSLEVVTRYIVTFESDDMRYPWSFTTKTAALDFVKECYQEEKPL